MSFNNMGKPIPIDRRAAAYDAVKEMGIKDKNKAMSLVSCVAEQLERDKPNEAMEAGRKHLDLTGVYRLFSHLLTEPLGDIIRQKLGDSQLGVLNGLARSDWRTNCFNYWLWNTNSGTIKILESLKKHGLVNFANGTYSISDKGRKLLAEKTNFNK